MPMLTLRHLAICRILQFGKPQAVAAQVADFLERTARDIDWKQEAYSLPKPLEARIDKAATGWLLANVLTGKFVETQVSPGRDGKMMATGEEV